MIGLVRITRTLLRLLFLLAVTTVISFSTIEQTAAHELRPAIVTAEIAPSGKFEVRISLNLEAMISGIGAKHSNTAQSDNAAIYNELRGATPEELRAKFTPFAVVMIDSIRLRFNGVDAKMTLQNVEIPPVGNTNLARISTVALTGAASAGAGNMQWLAGARIGDNVIRVVRAGESEPFYSAFLSSGEMSAEIPLGDFVQQSKWSGFVSYISIGFEHIVPKGLDHILFVVGLFLLSPHLRPLLTQVSCFTLAHTVSLALGVLGFINIPAAVVEPLIAASIVFVAVENLFTNRLQKWRPAVVFGFGLLHGLGFAGVLAEIGLPKGLFVAGLLGFNLGVEFGQLFVITVCFIAVGLWFRHALWYRQVITIPASLAIALVATFWFIQRVV